MKTTFTIILIILFLTFSGSAAVAQKSGYCKSFSLISNQEPNEATLFTVPVNKHFVLEKLYISGGNGQWSLIANNNFSIKGRLYAVTFRVYEFPNGTIILNSEDDLFFSYTSSNNELILTVIGYFDDTVAAMSADINGDGIVNMLDFAILSKQWLNGTS